MVGMAELKGFLLQRSAELSVIYNPHISLILEEEITYPFEYPSYFDALQLLVEEYYKR